MATIPSTPPASDARGLDALRQAAQVLKSLVTVDWAREGAGDAKAAVRVIEQAMRALTSIQAGALAAVEGDGSWAEEGQRTIQSWMSSETGSSRNTAVKALGLAKSLHEDLPHTRKALAGGVISEDHAQVLARECTKSPALLERLADPERGERYLVDQAQGVDATRFAKIAKSWAIETDPKGADRAWRTDAAKEDLILTPAEEGYRIRGWLTPANGALLSEALTAHMGRKAAEDTRTFPQRQADGLMSLVHQSLDAGFQMPNARIRPHLTITMDYDTLTRLVQATTDGGANGGDTNWAANWQPGDDHIISTTLDYDQLRGVPPATLPDGTPLPPAALSRFLCDSLLSRVIFGPQSTVLDSGREERIFTPGQTRAIIARDRHCQYPGCDEPPQRCEVHHSQEWFKHNGTTHVDLGVLLCWHHHDVVHQRHITITRTRGQWIFTNARGAPLHPHEQQSPNGTYLDHLTQIDTETGLLGPAPPQPSPPRARSSPPRGRGEGSTHRASTRPGRSTRPASTHRARTRARPRADWTQDHLLTSPEPPF